jgi:LPS-assembly lipoprotein
MIRLPRPVIVALVALLLAGCGFHLRNAIQLPDAMGPVRVVSRDPYSPLAQSLARALERAGAVPARAGDADASTLQILSEQWGDTPLSVDSQGRSQEYTLRHAVVFVMRRADGTVLVPQQVIELSRDYLSIPNQSIGVDSEREILADELRREMASAVLRRIDAASQAQLPAADTASPPPSAP